MSTTEKKFSFAKAGGPAAQPVEELKPAAPAPEAIPVTEGAPEAPQNTLAKREEYQPPAFYTGEEGEPVDPSDTRLPRLNLVQKSSKGDWLQHGFGSLLLKGEVCVAKVGVPFNLVVMGARPKIWIEKTKYQPNGGGAQARIARTIDEVVKHGGTDQWKFSKENDKSGSQKPWFQPSVTLAVLVEMPAGLPVEQQDHFAVVVGDKHYAPALLSVKSTNYDAVWITISSERRGLLSEGFNSRFIKAHTVIKPFTGGESAVFKLAFGDKTPVELREIAHKIATGN